MPARFHFDNSTPDCYLVHNLWIPPPGEAAHPPALPCLPIGPPACARIGSSRLGCNFAHILLRQWRPQETYAHPYRPYRQPLSPV